MSQGPSRGFRDIAEDGVPVTLLAVGDIMMGDCPPTFGFGVGSQIEKYGPDFPFEHSRTELNKADLLIGNLEAVLSEFDRDHTPFERMRHRGQPVAAEGLENAGFHVLTLANNHIMQHGRAAVLETALKLKERGIEVNGLRIDEIGLRNAVYLTRKNLRFGFLAYNQRPEQYFLDTRVDVPGDLETIRRDIADLRDQVDVLVVSVHWGDEYINRPSLEQIRTAHDIVDAGGDIILGHHPHVLQGIEEYRGAVIAYSLGNFVFDMPQTACRLGMILELLVFGAGKIKYSVTPVKINRRWQPVVLDPAPAEILQWIADLSGLVADRTNSYERDYVVELEKLNKKHRQDVLFQYLSNAFRYKPTFLMANLAGIIKRRL